MKAILKKVILVYMLVALVGTTWAGDKKYPVSDISLGLLADANAVIREYKIEFKINSINSTVEKRKLVVTILNAKAKHHNLLYVFYDKNRKINYLKGYLYDENGNLLEKLKKSSIEDQSAISDFSIYEDSRIKYAQLKAAQYPYTVEYEYEVQKDHTLFYPVWSPISNYKTSLEYASFDIYAPEDYKVRYKTQHLQNKVSVNSADGKKHYHWALQNLSPIKTEAYGPKFSEIQPLILTAPSVFAMEGYEGRMDTWQSFGSWIKTLNDGRADLPAETIQKIKDLTANQSSRRDKIKTIYKYLQANTRYVSIQLGIGGYQPFKASFVDEKKYGDCKALTYYTKTLLDVVGINSHYTLVRAGENEKNIPTPEFPVNRFNHAILCVPNENDTIWLECTSQRSPFGYLGSFTDDRNVLLITEDGGKLVRTPAYGKKSNLKKTIAEVILDDKGNAEVDLSLSYTGLQFDEQNINIWKERSIEEQKKWLYKNLDISGTRINKFNLNTQGDINPIGTKEINLTISKCGTVNGKRLFIKPNIFSNANFNAKKIEKRKSDFFLPKHILEQDTIVFQLPEGFRVEFKPETKKIITTFGEYHMNMSIEGNTLTFTRTLRINKGKYKPELYQEFFEFTKKVLKTDNAKAVFVNKT